MTLREQIEKLGRLNMATVWLRYDDVLDVVDQHECEDRDDIRDACEAAGLPRDGALWLLLNTVRARALSDPSLRCSYGHSIDKVGTHRCIPDRDALARALVLTGMYLDASDPLVGLDDPKNIADAIIAALEEP